MTDDNSLLPSIWPRPNKNKIIFGKYCRLEPLQIHHHEGLYDLICCPDSEERYQWLITMPKEKNPQVHYEWISKLVTSEDPFVYVVINQTTNKIVGRFNLMRIVPEHGCIEIGGVLWGPDMSKSTIGTESFFLITQYVFEDLKYRRFEWKCNDKNIASVNAAKRFGFTFEGTFRQHMVYKGTNRDTAWFSMLDNEWPKLKDSFVKWLSEDNFDKDGRQMQDLRSFR